MRITRAVIAASCTAWVRMKRSAAIHAVAELREGVRSVGADKSPPAGSSLATYRVWTHSSWNTGLKRLLQRARGVDRAEEPRRQAEPISGELDQEARDGAGQGVGGEHDSGQDRGGAVRARMADWISFTTYSAETTGPLDSVPEFRRPRMDSVSEDDIR